jgi:hypothetical protein
MANVPIKDSAFADLAENLLAYTQAHLTVFSIQETVFNPLLGVCGGYL